MAPYLEEAPVAAPRLQEEAPAPGWPGCPSRYHVEPSVRQSWPSHLYGVQPEFLERSPRFVTVTWPSSRRFPLQRLPEDQPRRGTLGVSIWLQETRSKKNVLITRAVMVGFSAQGPGEGGEAEGVAGLTSPRTLCGRGQA